MIPFYQKYISPLYHTLGRAVFGRSFGCRFTPTCSEYFKESVKNRGIIQGSLLGFLRFLRCNPFFKGGIDPVPARQIK